MGTLSKRLSFTKTYLNEKTKDFIITTKVNTIQNIFCIKKSCRIYK